MKLRPRERKFVAAAMVVALLVVGGRYVALPLWNRQTTGAEDLLRAQKQLRRQKELIAASKQIQSQTGALEARLTAEERQLLSAEDSNKAGAELEGWVVQRAGEQKLDVGRIEFLPSTPFGKTYARVAVQFELNGQMTQLVQFFDSLLKSEKLVALEDMQINSVGSKDKRVRCVVVVATLMPTAN
jgi:Tfp pilus assembly protein PilO